MTRHRTKKDGRFDFPKSDSILSIWHLQLGNSNFLTYFGLLQAEGALNHNNCFMQSKPESNQKPRRYSYSRVEKSPLMSGIKQSLLLVVPGSLSSLLSTVSSMEIINTTALLAVWFVRPASTARLSRADLWCLALRQNTTFDIVLDKLE